MNPHLSGDSPRVRRLCQARAVSLCFSDGEHWVVAWGSRGSFEAGELGKIWLVNGWLMDS
jgi:hypothetical protein